MERRPFTRSMLTSLKRLEVVVNNEYLLYIPEATKVALDSLADPAPTHVQFLPAIGGDDHYWISAAKKGAPGAIEIKESESKGTATIQASLPFKILAIKRAGPGRKERFPAELVPNSPYGAAIKVSVQPASNEPVEKRKKSGTKKEQAGQPAETTIPQAGAAGVRAAGSPTR